jgi:hypothetical protein
MLTPKQTKLRIAEHKKKIDESKAKDKQDKKEKAAIALGLALVLALAESLPRKKKWYEF